MERLLAVYILVYYSSTLLRVISRIIRIFSYGEYGLVRKRLLYTDTSGKGYTRRLYYLFVVRYL